MSQQQLSDILLAHWRLLWPLNPQERRERIEQVRLDIEFEEQMNAVAFEMAVA